MRTKTINLYRTKDQLTAIVLYASGKKLDSYEWQNGVCSFIFEDSEACEKVMASHYQCALKLSSRGFTEAFSTIKSILFTNR